MAKVKTIILGQDHPIFSEGVVLSSHRKDDDIYKAMKLGRKGSKKKHENEEK